MDIKDLKEKINEYRELIIILTTAAIATFVFHQYVYLKNNAKLQILDSEMQTTVADINRVTAEIQETQKTAQRLKDAMERLREMEERFMIVQSKLPSERQLSSILKGLVSDEARKTIKFISLKPLSPEQNGEYFKLPFQITMQGRFQSFGEYLERIENMPRIVTVENFRIDAKEEGLPLLSIKLFMNTYVLGGKR